MDIDEIKAAMKEQGYSITALAKKLSMNKETLGRVLSGKNPMTDTLRKHIELILGETDEAVFVYRVDITHEQVRELCGERYTGVEEKDGKLILPPRARKAVELVLRHNLRRLARIGAQWEGWSDEDRALLDALDKEPAAPGQPLAAPCIRRRARAICLITSATGKTTAAM